MCLHSLSDINPLNINKQYPVNFTFVLFVIFRHIHKIVKRDYQLCHVCLSVSSSIYMKHSAPTGQIFMKFDSSIFGKTTEKIQLSLKSDK